jgi:hypothetical protein
MHRSQQSFFDHLHCVRMAAFQFYLQSGKQRKVVWVGTTVIYFGQHFQVKKKV